MMSALYQPMWVKSMERPAGFISRPASMKATRLPLALEKPKRTAWPLPWLVFRR